MPTDIREVLDGVAPRRVPDLDFEQLWRRHRRSQVRHRVVGAALVALAAVAISVLPSLRARQPVEIAPVDHGVDHEIDAAEIGVGRAETIRRMVDAINDGDADAFADAFGEGGWFVPRWLFDESSATVAFGYQPLDEVELVRGWMAIVDAWGLEAQVRGCDLPGNRALGTWAVGRPPIVACEVTTRWRTLSLEVTEEWYFEFTGGPGWGRPNPEEGLLTFWDFSLLDLDPSDRSLPLGYSDLEQWETWLQAHHPDDAARFLNPRDRRCDPFPCEQGTGRAANDPAFAARVGPLMQSAEWSWTIDGHLVFPPGLIPYDPALAEQIETSIHDYLQNRP